MKAGKQAGRQTGRQCRSFHIATIYASPCPPPSPGPCCRGPHGSFIRAPHPQSRYPQNHKQRFRPKTGLLAQGHTAGKTPSHCTWRLTSVRKPPLPPLLSLPALHSFAAAVPATSPALHRALPLQWPLFHGPIPKPLPPLSSQQSQPHWSSLGEDHSFLHSLNSLFTGSYAVFHVLF